MRFFLFITALLLTGSITADALEAGAAKIDITAPVGTPLSGYGARMGRDSTAVHDPIWARALYLDDGKTRLFLVSVDMIGIMPELRERVLELATDVVPSENIILTATHTHSSQGATTRNILIRFVSGRYMPEVLEHTARGIVDAMRNAYEKRKRAALGYAVGKQEGLSVNRRYSDGPVDSQVGVISVEDADGNPISIITNFAAHPTSVGDEDLFSFSADYPGFYYLEMEELLGPECVPIFLNGAQGNQTIGNPENKSGWERTESVGRLLARRAHDIANTIAFSDVQLRLTHTTARLPLTLLNSVLPDQVFLQALEINDLLVNFFPGEACVELALEMRKRALARGYAAHFSVGLTNNHLMYFAPRHLYPDPTYESCSTFFGPGTEDWFYAQFESMMQLPAPETDVEETVETIPVMNVKDIDGGGILDLAGSPYNIGKQRGELFGADIQSRYKERVLAPIESGAWQPKSGMFSYVPSFINATSLALPVLGMGSRSLLQGLNLDIIREMEGVADGAHLPFDAYVLLQQAPLYDRIDDKSVLFANALCTMFAVVGERAGETGLLVGRNLDWPLKEEAIITRTTPENGNSFIQVGFSWNTGVFTAMNDSGLVLCVQSLENAAAARPEKAPLEFVLRDIVQYSDNYNNALERLRQCTYISGVHVLIAGYVEGKPRAAVVEFGEKVYIREAENGLLLGMKADASNASENERSRYGQVTAYFEPIEKIGKQDIETLLTTTATATDASSPMGTLWNEYTRHSVVFDPQNQEMRVALPGTDAAPGSFVNIPLEGALSHE